MAGKVNADKLINELQRSMALKESGAEGTNDTSKRHDGCSGHGCNAACGYHGYCDFEATRHYNTSEGSSEGTVSKGKRHGYYRRSMRLGYDY